METTGMQALQRTSLMKMTVPIFIELLLQMMVGNMDQIMLSHYNDTAVAAVGNANQVINILILTFNIITLASTVLVSQYLGAGDTAAVGRIYTLSVLVNLAVSTVLAAALFAFCGPVLALLQAPAELWAEAGAYLRITAAALPMQALMMTFSAFLRANARMSVITLSTGIINLLNIAGNAALIGGVGPIPAMGAAGAALSSALCRVLGLLLLAAAFYKTVPGEKLSMKALRPFPTGLLKRLLGIGLPSGGEGLSWNLSQAASLAFVNIIGSYAVTARMYASMFAQISFVLISAVGQAGQIRVGYCIGGRDPDRADRENRHILRTFVPVTVGLSVLVALLAGPLFGLLTSDARVIALGQLVMLVEIPLELGRAFNIVLVRNLQAVGDVKFPVAVGIASQWLVAVGLSGLFGLVLGWGLPGIWLGYALDECLRACVFVARWKSGKWKTISLL